jgi:endonuclease/exonuclease/phosphatase family metal-dependent hydrolase
MEKDKIKKITNSGCVLVFLYTVLLQILITGFTGCSFSGTERKEAERIDTLVIMTWNIQTLFDGIEDGIEYDDFRESAGWTHDKYKGRLNVIASAIGGMERKPDIIAVQEVESPRVMADLAGILSVHGYGWTHFAMTPEMALGVGLLSSFPLQEAKSHSVYVDGDIAPRPMLEARINISAGNSSFIIFVCHWKSKLGGEDITESIRRASARIIVRRLKELYKNEPGLPVIIAGDLNENHDEFYRHGGSIICALLPDDPRAAEFTGFLDLDDELLPEEYQKDFIVLSKNKPPNPRYFPDGIITMYSPWDVELENGSYSYRNTWETIDHFLLSQQLFDGTGWDFDNCEVLDYPPFVNAKGLPDAYNPRTGSGLSDHLPLLLYLKMQD